MAAMMNYHHRLLMPLLTVTVLYLAAQAEAQNGQPISVFGHNFGSPPFGEGARGRGPPQTPPGHQFPAQPPPPPTGAQFPPPSPLPSPPPSHPVPVHPVQPPQALPPPFDDQDPQDPEFPPRPRPPFPPFPLPPPQQPTCEGQNEAFIRGTEDACCPATCQDPSRTRCEEVECFSGAGCVCQPGFIRSREGGPCVPKGQCTNQNRCSQPHQFWQPCAIQCTQQVCNQPPKPCPYMPCYPGSGRGMCVCESGFVLAGEGSTECISKAQCESCPGPSQIWSNCVGGQNGCEPCCRESAQPGSSSISPQCTKPCVIGCRCAPGYHRLAGPGSPCVPQGSCPGQQPPNPEQPPRPIVFPGGPVGE